MHAPLKRNALRFEIRLRSGFGYEFEAGLKEASKPIRALGGILRKASFCDSGFLRLLVAVRNTMRWGGFLLFGFIFFFAYGSVVVFLLSGLSGEENVIIMLCR